MGNDVQSALPVGSTLHNGKRVYTIKKVLGIGGFGITYLAEGYLDNIMMQFAVKEFFMKDFCDRNGNDIHYTQASSANVEFGRKSFYAEANRLNQQNIKHHNLVSINEVFEENNTAYYVMEYIKGVNLRQYFSKPCHESEALAIMKLILSAIATLHSHDITHFDIKPENI